MSKGNKNGRVSVVSTIIGALCIILYIGALSYGVLNVYSNVTGRRALGDREFDNLADLAAAAGVLGFMDEKFIQTIQDAIDGSETILGVVISGSRGEFAFERERGTVISWVNNSPRFVPRFAVTNPPKSRALRIDGQRNTNIWAVYGYLDYDFCLEIVKRTLLAVLFSLTLAFFTLLMDALLTKNAGRPARVPETPPGEDAEAEGSAAGLGGSAGPPNAGSAAGNVTGGLAGNSGGKNKPGIPERGQPAPAYRESPKTGEEGISSSDDTGESGSDESNSGESSAGEFDKSGGGDWEDFGFDDDDDFPDFDDLDSSDKEESPALPFAKAMETPAPEGSAEAPAPELSARDAPAEVPPAGPQGLFSPRGNVGWESYTEDRLESELHRCASLEQDLALFAITFKEPEKLGKEQFRRFCEEAVSYFEHRDLIFEFGDQGLWIIRPNYSLEQGLTASEEFSTRIFSKLSRPAGSKIDLRFGISSRSGRLIDAERIMLEAKEALKRAVEDPASRVVAFKSDPEKYRQFVSGRTLRSA